MSNIPNAIIEKLINNEPIARYEYKCIDCKHRVFDNSFHPSHKITMIAWNCSKFDNMRCVDVASLLCFGTKYKKKIDKVKRKSWIRRLLNVN